MGVERTTVVSWRSKFVSVNVLAVLFGIGVGRRGAGSFAHGCGGSTHTCSGATVSFDFDSAEQDPRL